MALVVKDRVKQTTTTTGTGSIVLNGNVSGFQTFAAALTDGDTTYYGIFEPSTNEYEVGLGTWTESTATLARTTVLESSNSGSAVSLTAQAEVFITQPAEKAVYLNSNGDVDLGGNKILFGNLYSTTGDLPSASTYHGMFAHVHGTGKAYYAHAGNWIELVNEDTSGNVSMGGNLTVTGDLTVNGTTTTIDTTNTVVTDSLIELANGTTGTPANDAGLVIERGDSNNAFIGFDESADKFIVGTGSFTGASTGDLTITTGTLVANVEGNVTGNVTGNADTATAWATGRTISLTGDVTGTVTGVDGTGNASIATTIQPNSVALSTDTTGNYVQSVASGSYITGGAAGSEGATLTIGVDATTTNTASKVVARDASGNFSAGTITAALSGNASTATALATGRTISLTGDVTGTSGSFDGSGNVSIATTIGANSVALGTDTTGNYVATITAGTGISGSSSTEGGTPTIALAAAGAGAGTYGSTADGTKIDTITLDAYGRVTAVATGATGDIEGVTAGTNLNGGGTSGTVTLNVDSSPTFAGVVSAESVQEDYDALSGTTPAPDADNAGAFSLTTSGNTTFTFGSVTSGRSVGFIVELTAGGTHTITWPTSVEWAGGTAPDAPASGETDILVFWTRDGGTTWYGIQSIDAAA